MYLIDTNVISEVRKRERANRGVLDFFADAARIDANLYLSAITVGELRRGAELVRYRGDEQQAAMLDAWLEVVLEEYSANILTLDTEICQMWGRLRVPHPEYAIDKLIAATALIHDLTVVTRNVEDFAGLNLRVLNPFH